VAAVRYLNTVPLVWGMLHGAERGRFDLRFCTPAVCADSLESGDADIGIVPAIELRRLALDVIPGASIASRGPVRSILLISKCPPERIRTLAADSSSRTSVALARVLLAERFGNRPRFLSMAPNLEAMLQVADAALIIGDPALHIDPARRDYHVLDLGAEWTAWTGKPMVFAVWAARRGLSRGDLETAFRASAAFGRRNIEAIVRAEAPPRGIAEGLARDYLNHHVDFDFGEDERAGLDLFLEYAHREVAV